MFLWHWTLWFTGLNDEGGRAYGLWSGFGGAVPDFLILGSLITWWRHTNCHVKGCPRLGRHEYEMEGAKYKLCPIHHPAVDHTVKKSGRDFATHHAKPKGKK